MKLRFSVKFGCHGTEGSTARRAARNPPWSSLMYLTPVSPRAVRLSRKALQCTSALREGHQYAEHTTTVGLVNPKRD